MDSHDSARECFPEPPEMKSTIKGHIQYLDWVKSLESRVPRVSFGIRKRPEGWNPLPTGIVEAPPNYQLKKSILKKPLPKGWEKTSTSSKDSMKNDVQIDPHHKISITVCSQNDMLSTSGHQQVNLKSLNLGSILSFL